MKFKHYDFNSKKPIYFNNIMEFDDYRKRNIAYPNSEMRRLFSKGFGENVIIKEECPIDCDNWKDYYNPEFTTEESITMDIISSAMNMNTKNKVTDYIVINKCVLITNITIPYDKELDYYSYKKDDLLGNIYFNFNSLRLIFVFYGMQIYEEFETLKDVKTFFDKILGKCYVDSKQTANNFLKEWVIDKLKAHKKNSIDIRIFDFENTPNVKFNSKEEYLDYVKRCKNLKINIPRINDIDKYIKETQKNKDACSWSCFYNESFNEEEKYTLDLFMYIFRNSDISFNGLTSYNGIVGLAYTEFTYDENTCDFFNGKVEEDIPLQVSFDLKNKCLIAEAGEFVSKEYFESLEDFRTNFLTIYTHYIDYDTFVSWGIDKYSKSKEKEYYKSLSKSILDVYKEFNLENNIYICEDKYENLNKKILLKISQMI